MTVAELGRRISATEVRRWIHLWAIEADEQRTAELAARASAGATNQISRGAR